MLSQIYSIADKLIQAFILLTNYYKSLSYTVYTVIFVNGGTIKTYA